MSPRVTRVICIVAFGYALVQIPELGADDKDTKTPATTSASTAKATDKAPDFSKYVFVSDTVGEIVKADSNSLTMRVTWYSQPGNKNPRPNLSQHNRNSHTRPPNTPQAKEEHTDYTVQFVTDTQIRTKILPPKTDEKGKKVDYTAKELEDLKGKWSFPGYGASTSDLVAGTIVEVHLIREKSIAADKATDADLRVKYALITGKDANPPKDTKTDKQKN
jgi:hypothetical protein